MTQTHDGQPLANEILLINGNVVPLNAAGMATFTSATPGVFTVTAKAFDAEGNEGDATQTLTFLTPPNGLPAPTAGFNETVVTPVVTMPTAITAPPTRPDLLQYTLQYSVEGQNQWTTFATGTTPVVNGLLGTIDPTMMDNGFYDVRLTVEDTSGQVTTADEVYEVDGDAKIGNFTLSFQDVNIPGEGIPITVTRTYNSMDKNTSGDFGYGWTISVSNMKVETFRRAGGRVHPNGNPAAAHAGQPAGQSRRPRRPGRRTLRRPPRHWPAPRPWQHARPRSSTASRTPTTTT